MKTKSEAILEDNDALNNPSNENEEKEQSKSKRLINTVINVILIIAIVVAVVATYVSFVSTSGNGVPNIFGLRLFSIQTDSMYPELMPGDLVIGTNVKDKGDLRPNDIITYWTIIDGERVLNTHRIIEIYDGGGYWIFQTKGDNNTIEDPLTVHESEVVAQYKFRIPGIGKVFNYLQTSTGFLLVVVLPVFIFFIYHLVQFFRVLFEYQNVKNRIKYEQERGRTEDLIAAHAKAEAVREAERAKMEAEIREQLRAEMMAEMAAKEQSAEQTEQSEDNNE
ncbi:MAG: signal peptidase I [Clostridia bacterium]|nr:signal peptidase I [Clostridia bacterium]